jgi:hypothetical protein
MDLLCTFIIFSNYSVLNYSSVPVLMIGIEEPLPVVVDYQNETPPMPASLARAHHGVSPW